MNEFKGTKGRWVHEGDGKYRMSIDVRFGDTGIKTIATIHTNGTVEEVKANASIIAHSPEMHELLKEILASEILKGTILESKTKRLLINATEI